MSSRSGTQYKSTLLTISIHVSQLSALHWKYRSQLLHPWYGQPYRYVQVPVKYEVFWKTISIKSEFLNFILLVGTFWHLCERSEFRVVHNEPGANSTCLHQGVDWDGPERNRTVVFWTSPEGKGQ